MNDTRAWGTNSPNGYQNSPSPSRGRGGGGEWVEPILVGEVIESSTTEFLAQALELDSAPAFGAFVEVATDDGLTVIGIVAHVQTSGIDPGSRAIMRGHGDVRDERIYEENPDLPLVLRTTFRATVVGFIDTNNMYQFLPPRPPRLHYSVFTCEPHRVKTFTGASLDYLQVLLNAPEVPVDELLAANLRYTAATYVHGEEFLHQAGRELAQLLRADYPRLSGILKRSLAPMETA